MAKITIDGVEHEFEEGKNLFEAIAIANGEKLPHFCYHEGLSIAGVCRMCQVEIEGVPKLQIACNSTVRDGMVVKTRTQRVKDAVQQILNFHLLHHPVDCPVCDQAGECSLQDQYMDHGLYDAAIDVEDKIAKGKVKPIGELVMLDAERCVLCARCTRFTREITRTHELGIFNRGNHAEVDVAPGKTLDNNYSLNTVDICPVGALTSRDFRFRKRVWWLSQTDGICPGCATGCNLVLDHNDGTAYRMKPRPNAAVNDFWMCDHGRLLYKRIATDDRLEAPLVKSSHDGDEPSSWDHALGVIESTLQRMGDGRKVVVVGSPHATLEELYALKSLLGQAAGANVLGYRLAGSEMDEADGILMAADRTPNAEGARRLGLREFTSADLAAAASSETLLLILDNDLVGLDEAAGKALDGYGCVIHVGTHRNLTAERAQVNLPGRMWAERSGSWVNKDGRAQAFSAALPGPADARDPLSILKELAGLLGHEPSWDTAGEVLAELSAREAAFGALAGGIDPLGVPLDAAASAEAEVDRG